MDGWTNGWIAGSMDRRCNELLIWRVKGGVAVDGSAQHNTGKGPTRLDEGGTYGSLGCINLRGIYKRGWGALYHIVREGTTLGVITRELWVARRWESLSALSFWLLVFFWFLLLGWPG